MREDRQTYRHAGRNTSHPSRRQSNQILAPAHDQMETQRDDVATCLHLPQVDVIDTQVRSQSARRRLTTTDRSDSALWRITDDRPQKCVRSFPLRRSLTASHVPSGDSCRQFSHSASQPPSRDARVYTCKHAHYIDNSVV